MGKKDLTELVFKWVLISIVVAMVGLVWFKLATWKESVDFQLCRDLGGIPIPSNWDSSQLAKCQNFHE